MDFLFGFIVGGIIGMFLMICVIGSTLKDDGDKK